MKEFHRVMINTKHASERCRKQNSNNTITANNNNSNNNYDYDKN